MRKKELRDRQTSRRNPIKEELYRSQQTQADTGKSEENDKPEHQIKEDAAQDMVVILADWKKHTFRQRILRRCLAGSLVLSCLAFAGLGYYSLYNSIPSVIRIRAGVEQSIDLGVPAKGEVVSVSDQGTSNIPKGAVTIDCSRPVTLKAAQLSDDYQMMVKLFGFLPFKQVGIQVIEDQELIPVGVPIGIYVKTEGILVIGVGEFDRKDGIKCSPAKYILKSGDYILSVNGESVMEKDDFIERVEQSGGNEIVMTVKRQDEVMDIKVKPERNATGDWKIGVWVRDNAQGVGTMTFIDADGNFGALGHGINDVDTSTLMDMDDGTLYRTEIVSIKKGAAGEPGEMTGMIIYSEDRILGDIHANSIQGIFGTCNQKALSLTEEKPIPIGLKQEIEEGPAKILCTVDGTPKYYDVEITAIHLDHDNVNRGIELKVTDPALLSITGGIVQGMSGAPIIQNGKFIGAVTHVLVQDSTRGYGIFIENMLAH